MSSLAAAHSDAVTFYLFLQPFEPGAAIGELFLD
jgi:hypothetical protein